MAKAATKKAPARKAAATKTAAKKTTAKTAAKTVAKKPAKAAASKTTAKAAVKAVAKKAAKGPATTNGILTLRHIAEALSEMHELPKRQMNEMMAQVVDFIAKSLKKGEKIRLSGLGILQVRKRAARMGRNPQTGEPVKIKASKKIAFRAAKDLKDSI